MTIETAFQGRAAVVPELRTSKAGKIWTRFGLAVGEDDATQWVSVSCFGAVAERAAERLAKGDKVYNEGSLKLEEWTDSQGNHRAGLKVCAWKVEPLGQIGQRKPTRPKNGSGSPGASSDAAAENGRSEPSLAAAPPTPQEGQVVMSCTNLPPWTLLDPNCWLCRTNPRAGGPPRDAADRAYGLLSLCPFCLQGLLELLGGPELAGVIVERDIGVRSTAELYALNFVERDARRRRPRKRRSHPRRTAKE